MLKKIFGSFAKTEFSKKIAVVVTALYIMSVFFTFAMKVAFGQDLTFILEYVQYSFVIVLGGYIGKAAVENVTKIKISDLLNKDNSNGTDASNQ